MKQTIHDRFTSIILLIGILILSGSSIGQLSSSWSHSTSISIDNLYIDEDLSNWTLVFDQSFSPIFTQVNGMLDADGSSPSLVSGADIRFSSDAAGNNELAFDLRSWITNNDPALASCEVAVKIPLVDEDAPTTIYMWWGNASASAYVPTDPYGQYNAYDNIYKAVWTDGGKTERTSYQSNGVEMGGIVAGNAQGQVGSATTFNGSSNYFQVPNNGNLDMPNGTRFTYTALVKTPGGTGADQVLLDTRRSSAGGKGYGFLVNSSGISATYIRDENNVPTSWGGKSNIADNTWHTISSVYDDGSAVIANGGYVYIDGVQESLASIAEIDAKISDATCNIGYHNLTSSAWSYFVGTLDEFRISTAIRSAAWIKAEHHNLNSTPGFLTVGSIPSAGNYPGGVSSNLRLWLKADAGITGSTPVTSWADQSPYGFSANNGVAGPDIIPDDINFNPALDFETTESFTVPGGILGSEFHDEVCIFIVNKTNTVQNSTVFMEQMNGTDRVSSHLPWGDSHVYFDFGTWNNTGRVSGAWGTAAGNYHIWTMGSSNTTTTPWGTRKSIFRDGSLLYSNNNNFSGNGSNSNMTIGPSHDGNIAEFIVYTGIPSALHIEQIQSYLSIKYGIPKESSNYTSTGIDERDYFAGDGSVIWDYSVNSVYASNIAGIAREDASTLNQLKSKSTATGTSLTVEKTGAFPDDREFMIWGNNGASGIDNDVPAPYNFRAARIWKSQVTGTPGLVNVTLDINALGVLNTGNVGDYALLIDTDETFSSGATIHTTGASLVGNEITFTNVALANGNFFTLAMNIETPAGIASIPRSIYALRRVISTYTGNVIRLRRSTDGALQYFGFTASGELDTAAILAFVRTGDGYVSNWYDQSGNGVHTFQPDETMQPQLVQAGVINRINGRPTLVFDGSNDRLNYSSPSAPTNNFTTLVAAKTTVTHQIDNQSNSGTGGTSGQRYLLGAPHQGTYGGQGISLGTNGISNYEHGSGYMPATAVYSGTVSGLSLINVIYTNRRPRIYLNGELKVTGLTSPKSIVYASNQIGSGSYGAFSGEIPEMYIFPEPLPDSSRNILECEMANYLGIELTIPDLDIFISSTYDSVGCEASIEEVAWEVSSLSNVTVDGNDDIRKTSGGDNWNGGAASNNLVYDNGYVEFTASEETIARMLGLSTTNANSSWSSINYAIYLQSNREFNIRESGSGSKIAQQRFYTGDKFRIAVENGVVHYYHNSALVYTSAVPPTLPLRVDLSIYSQNGTFKDVIVRNLVNDTFNATVLNADTPVVYQWRVNGGAVGSNSASYNNPSLNNDDEITCDISVPINCGVSTKTLTSNKITLKTPSGRLGVESYVIAKHDSLGCQASIQPVIWDQNAMKNVRSYSSNLISKRVHDNEWDGAAASINKVYNQGYMEFTATEETRHRVIGLSTTDANPSITSIQYGIYLKDNRTYTIRESGSGDLIAQTRFYTGDKFRIAVESGVVKYYHNNALVYTSGNTPTLPMLVDVSIYDQWGTFDEVYIRNLISDTLEAYALNATNPVSYQWTLNGIAIPGAVNPVYVNPNFGENDTITCDISFLGSCGNVSSNITRIDSGYVRPDMDIYTLAEHDSLACQKAIENVIWDQTAMENVESLSDNSIRKRVSDNIWDGGAASLNVVYDQGYMEFTASEETRHRVIGLSSTNPNSSISFIQFGIYLKDNRTYSVRESGSGDLLTQTRFYTGDKFRIAVESGVVKYYHNNALVYTSSNTPTLPMLVDVSIYDQWGTFREVKIGNLSSGTFTAHPVNTVNPVSYQWYLNGSPEVNDTTNTYTNLNFNESDQIFCEISFPGSCGTLSSGTTIIDSGYVRPDMDIYTLAEHDSLACQKAIENVIWDQTAMENVESLSDNSIRKRVSDNIWDGGAASLNVVYDQGYMEFTASEETRHRVIGLSSTNPNSSISSIQFGIYLKDNRTYSVRESGSGDLVTQTRFYTGDKFRIAVESGVVKYYHNNALVYTSSNTPTLPMLVDVSIYDQWGTFREVKIGNLSSGTFTAHPVNTVNPVSYQWYLNGSPEVNDTTNTYTNLNFNEGDQIFCEISFPGSCGSLTSGITRIDSGYTRSDISVYVLAEEDSNACLEVIQPAIWNKNSLENIQIFSNTLLSKRVSDNSWDGGASSLNKVHNNGYMEFTATEETRIRMIGLSQSDVNSSWNTIEYGIYLYDNRTYTIREAGSGNLTGQTRFYTNDVFRISIENGVVKYYRNNGLIFISSNNTTNSMLVDVAIYDQWGTFNNVFIANGTTGEFSANVVNGASPISYQWLLNGSPVGTDTSIYVNQTLQVNDQLTCTVNFPGSCTDWTSLPISITQDDIEDPFISCLSDTTLNTDPGLCSAVVDSIFPDAEDNCSIKILTWTLSGATTGNSLGLGINDASGQMFNIGTTTVTYYTEDQVGLNATCSFLVTIEDNEVPTIACPADVTQSADYGSCGANVIIAAPVTSDNCGIDSVYNNYNNSSDASGFYPVGTTTVTWIVRDVHGNIDSCNQSIIVTDNELPTITCAPDQSVIAPADSCNANVTVISPISTNDNCGVATVINDYNGTSDASDRYPVGLTTVTWTITDIHGHSDTCTQVIEVTGDCGIIWNGTQYLYGSGTNSAPGVGDGGKDFYVLGPGALLPGDARVNKMIVAAGQDLTIPASVTLTVVDTIDNNGTVTINSSGSLVQESIADNNLGTGTYIVERDGIRAPHEYQAWSSPVQSAVLQGAGGVFNGCNPCRTLAYNASTQRWKYDYLVNSVYNCGASPFTFTPRHLIADDPADNIMDVGRGYFIPGQAGSPTIRFNGKVNNGAIVKPVYETTTDLPFTGDHWNLVGNPYPSALSISDWLNSNSGVLTSVAVYLWDDDGSGGADYHEYDDYATVNHFGFVGGENGNGKYPIHPLGITSGQGFFIEAIGDGNIIFTNVMRMPGNNDKFYKTSPDASSKIWINLIDDNGSQRQALLGFDADATMHRDKRYDAPVIKPDGILSIGTMLESLPMAIQGQPTLGEDEIREVPLHLFSRDGGKATLSFTQNETMNEVEVYLKMPQQIAEYPVGSVPFDVHLNKGENPGYVLVFRKGSVLANGSINKVFDWELINSNDELIIEITGNLDTDTRVEVLDIKGIVHETVILTDRITRITTQNWAVGMYLVHLNSGSTDEVKRVVIR
jgi:hypothetical protein